MKKFEVGKWYECYDRNFSSIKVEKRTPKFVYVVDEEKHHFRMWLREDDNHVEYAVDMSVPKNWRDTFTYSADWEIK